MSSSVSLTNAVTSGDERAVSALLARGADVNESTSGGQTVLILAVILGHTDLVQLLVKAGADPQLRDNLGLNAIEWAKRRGSTQALELLTNAPKSPAASRKIIVNIEEPQKSVVEAPPTPPETESRQTVTDDEKSRKWLAGLRQRLDEQEVRKLNQSDFTSEPARPEPALPPPLTSVAAAQETASKADRVMNNPPIEASAIDERKKVLTPLGNRKRCPKCNAIYNGDLVSYCAHHIVPLVDADEPILPEPPKPDPPLFWIIVVVTLAGSIVLGSLITTYMYKSNLAAARSAEPPPSYTQKGFPELGGDLVGKAASLPDAECPKSGPEPLTGTVVVNVKVDRKGQVYWARGSGGDWLMRGASTEAAMKTTFSQEKLRGREIEGTITYTFKPQ